MSISVDAFDQLEEEQDTFNDLPNELVVLIFSHLSPEDLACRVSKVCSRWLEVAKDLVLWESAVLTYDDLYASEFQETITFAPCLSKVEINMFKFMNYDTVRCILLGPASIKYLSLYPSSAVAVDWKLSILNHYSDSLKELNIYMDDSYVVADDINEGLVQIFHNMDKLEVLTVRGYVSTELSKLLFLCNEWKSLKALDISGFTISDHAGGINFMGVPNPWQSFILLMLEKNIQTLRKLSLPVGVFDLTTQSYLQTKLVGSSIENLKICEICLIGAKNLHCLKTLHVVGTSHKHLASLRSDCMSIASPYTSVFQWITTTPQFLSIKQLTIENIIDDDRNLVHNLLIACQNLESFTLFSGCNSPSHLQFILSKLFPSLLKLSLHHMPCLRSRHLELITHHLPNLQVLNLRNNALTDGILQYYRDHVQSRMPNLMLVSDWGYWNRNGGRPWQNNCYSNQWGKSKVLSLENPSSSDLDVRDKEKIRRMLSDMSDYEDDD